MATTERYDAIVIGSGQGGKPLAMALAAAGRKTAVIERAHVGGTCVNYGCTPTKTMVASANVAHLVRRSADYGVHTAEIAIDMKKIRERKRAIVKQFRSSSESSLEDADKLTLVRGEASFESAHRVRVRGAEGDQIAEAPQIFINTGLSPVQPPIDGLDQVASLDNASVMELDRVPDHLLVLGGGYVGLEFAQMFRQFGSQVTVIDRGEHVLSQEDTDISQEVEKVLRADGLTLLQSSTVRRAHQDGDRIALSVVGPQGEKSVQGSHLLVAAGRRPNIKALNLAAAGIKTDDSGFIQVNDRLETGVDGVYALGDVKGGPAFTHVSYHDYQVLKTNLLDGGRASIADRPLLYTVFIDPQLGRLGLNQRQAREQGREVRVAKMPMSKVARAMETDDTRGVVKAIVDAQSEQILGCTVFGQQGGEVMSMLQIAMMGRLPYTRLRDGMFAHPLFAESLNTLFGSFED
ncbi:MAG: mercuric reductase [Pirellulales bacterium]